MCYRYPELNCEYDIDPDLGGVQPYFVFSMTCAEEKLIISENLHNKRVSTAQGWYRRG